MLISKAAAVVIAVLMSSSVSAEAMEFADRPGTMPGFSSSANGRMLVKNDRLRRQIDQSAFSVSRTLPNRIADRPRPLVIHIERQSMSQDRVGRLSPEFSALVRYPSIQLDPLHAASIRRKPVAKTERLKFEDRPGFSMLNSTVHLGLLIVKRSGRSLV